MNNLLINNTINSNLENNRLELPIQDIQLPESVSFWPPAVAWWVFSFLLLSTILIGIYRMLSNYRKKWSYRDAALTLLRESYNAWGNKHIDSFQAAQQMNRLLKRTAMNAYPAKNNLGALTGQIWIDFLNRQTPETSFNLILTDLLLTQQYQTKHNITDTTDIDINELYHACTYWIKKHKVLLNTDLIDNHIMETR